MLVHEAINTAAAAPIIQVQGVSKAFPGVQALNDVSIAIAPGEIHGLVGKNGAGKSTLVRVLMGLCDPDAGIITVNQQRHRAITSNQALEAGIAYVPQHIAMMDSLTVAENILAGDLPTGRFGLISWGRVYQDAADRLQRLGLRLDVHKRVEGLGVAEQTMLAIAKALFGHARLIILDEPTASLPRADIDHLFEFIRALRGQGVSFIYISHHLEEVFEICDRVTVMRDGQCVGTYPVAGLSMADLTRLIVGEDVQEYQRSDVQQPETALEVRELTRRGCYEDISFTVHKGEVIGISGLQGCGAEALARGLFGLEPWGIGDVRLNGKPFTAANPRQALNQGLAYLPQDRTRLGLVGVRPVRENVTYTILDRLSGFLRQFINPQQERTAVEAYIRELEIITPSQEQMVRLLSGGNQQKVVFAKLAATKPSALFLHDPTMGVDVRAKQDIYRIVDELSKHGAAVVIISSEVRELLGVCDRILVMYEGKITHEFKRGAPQTTPENILIAIEGGAS